MFSNNSFSDLVTADPSNRHYAVLFSASTLFACLENPTQAEIISFEELALRFLPKLSILERAEIADTLSTLNHLPRQVALNLATDDICVARPVLNNFYGFHDNDLLMVLAKGTTLHALALCGRRNLSTKILHTLSSYKMPELRHEEAGILISQKNNTPLTKDKKKLEFFLDHEEAYILDAMRWAEEQAQEQLPADLTSLLIKAQDNAERAIDFVKLARSRQRQGFIDLLSAECQLQEAQSRSIIEDVKGYALAICLKSLALPPATAREAFLLLNDKLARNTDQIFILDRFYSQITPSGCRFLLGHWQNKSHFAKERERHSYKPVFSGETFSQKHNNQEQDKDIKTSRPSYITYKNTG